MKKVHLVLSIIAMTMSVAVIAICLLQINDSISSIFFEILQKIGYKSYESSYYHIIINGALIIALSLTLGIKNKPLYIISIVICALATNIFGIIASVIALISFNREHEQKNTTDNNITTENKNLESTNQATINNQNKPASVWQTTEKEKRPFIITPGNLTMLIVQMVNSSLYIFMAAVILYFFCDQDFDVTSWGETAIVLILLIILFVLFLASFILCNMLVLVFSIVCITVKQRWCFKILLILGFASLQPFAIVSGIRVLQHNQ